MSLIANLSFVFQIVVRANETIIKNITVSSDRLQTRIPIYGLSPYKIYNTQVSAVNKIGVGPSSSLYRVSVDPSVTLLYDKSLRGMFGGGNSELGYTWLIVFLVSLAVMLIIISGLLIFYRRRHGSMKQKSMGYLVANTTESFHSQINNGSSAIRSGVEGCNITSLMNSSTLSSGDQG